VVIMVLPSGTIIVQKWALLSAFGETSCLNLRSRQFEDKFVFV